MKGNMTLIPKTRWKENFSRIHSGHMGIVKYVESCLVFAQNRKNRIESLMQTTLPARPWMKMGMDLQQNK